MLCKKLRLAPKEKDDEQLQMNLGNERTCLRLIIHTFHVSMSKKYNIISLQLSTKVNLKKKKKKLKFKSLTQQLFKFIYV